MFKWHDQYACVDLMSKTVNRCAVDYVGYPGMTVTAEYYEVYIEIIDNARQLRGWIPGS